MLLKISDCPKMWFVQNVHLSLPFSSCSLSVKWDQRKWLSSVLELFFFLVLKVIFALNTAIIAWGHPFPKGQRYIGTFLFFLLFLLLMTWIEVIWHNCMWRGWAKMGHLRETLRLSNKEIISLWDKWLLSEPTRKKKPFYVALKRFP